MTALVIFAHLVPATLRLDYWPLTTYPMFSEPISKERFFGYRVYLRDAEGALTFLPIDYYRLLYYLIPLQLRLNRPERLKDLVAKLLLDPSILSRASGTVELHAIHPDSFGGSQGIAEEKIFEFPIAEYSRGR